MTEQEKIEFEKEIRHKVLLERMDKQRAYKAAWRKTHKENIKRYNRKYYEKKKAEREKKNHEQ